MMDTVSSVPAVKALKGYQWVKVLQEWVKKGTVTERRHWEVGSVLFTEECKCVLHWMHIDKPYEEKHLVLKAPTVELAVYKALIAFAKGRQQAVEAKGG